MIATAAFVAATLTSSGTAHAATPADQSSETATHQLVAGMLKYNPGAKQVGRASVEVRKGVVMTVQPHVNAAPQSVTPSASISLCSFRHGDAGGWLCLYRHSNWGGYNLDLYNCGNVNLGDIYMGDGRQWNDQVSSIDNDQTGGVVSVFYNYSGSGDPNSSQNWRKVLALPGGNYLRNLADNPSDDGGNANDKIDIVHVC